MRETDFPMREIKFLMRETNFPMRETDFLMRVTDLPMRETEKLMRKMIFLMGYFIYLIVYNKI